MTIRRPSRRRVGIAYRAVAALDGGTLTWFWIGSHADYDKLLGQM